MLVKRGIAVSPGVAIGPAWIFGAERLRIRHYTTKLAIDADIERFRAAVDVVCDEIETNQQIANEQLG